MGRGRRTERTDTLCLIMTPFGSALKPHAQTLATQNRCADERGVFPSVVTTATTTPNSHSIKNRLLAYTIHTGQTQKRTQPPPQTATTTSKPPSSSSHSSSTVTRRLVFGNAIAVVVWVVEKLLSQQPTDARRHRAHITSKSVCACVCSHRKTLSERVCGMLRLLFLMDWKSKHIEV